MEEKVPAPHGRQAEATDCPIRPLKVPALHATQCDCPVAWLKEPTPHAAHVDCPDSALKVPAPHGKQPTSPVALPNELNEHASTNEMRSVTEKGLDLPVKRTRRDTGRAAPGTTRCRQTRADTAAAT